MAGEAVSGKFMLGSATLMLGAMDRMLDLGVADSVGLVKDITTRSTPGFTTLSQGVQNDEVASVKTSNEIMIEGQMYEYTFKNLSYLASLNGAIVTPVTGATTTTGALATSGSPSLTPAVIPVASAAGIVADTYIAIKVGAADQIFVRRVVSVASLNVTVERGIPVAVPSGSVVELVNKVDVGSNADQPYLSCKIVGQLADNSWVTQYYPKVRVTSGLSLAFKTGDFDNMAIGIKPFVCVTGDPFYSRFLNADGTRRRGDIYVNG